MADRWDAPGRRPSRTKLRSVRRITGARHHRTARDPRGLGRLRHVGGARLRVRHGRTRAHESGGGVGLRAEVIGVGTEILLGQICNTNAQWISQELATIGVDVPNHQVVGDNEQRIAEAFRLAIGRAEVVIATGGLGPTQDDITREGLTAALGAALVRDHSIERFLRERFAGFGRAMPESNLKQCDVPQGARVILPMRGTAPGLMCLLPDSRRAYLVPGVPSEMREMMTGKM